EDVGAPAEHGQVPVVTAAVLEAPGPLQVGLLHEALDLERARGPAATRLDVAQARGRVRRLEADRDQPAAAIGDPGRPADGGPARGDHRVDGLTPGSSASSAAREVSSQGASMSVRPKWP